MCWSRRASSTVIGLGSPAARDASRIPSSPSCCPTATMNRPAHRQRADRPARRSRRSRPSPPAAAAWCRSVPHRIVARSHRAPHGQDPWVTCRAQDCRAQDCRALARSRRAMREQYCRRNVSTTLRQPGSEFTLVFLASPSGSAHIGIEQTRRPSISDHLVVFVPEPESAQIFGPMIVDITNRPISGMFIIII